MGDVALTVYGACAVSLMLLMYALEHRGDVFILGFALACLLSSAYGFLAGTWPFGVLELVWSAVALRRHPRLPIRLRHRASCHIRGRDGTLTVDVPNSFDLTQFQAGQEVELIVAAKGSSAGDGGPTTATEHSGASDGRP